MTQQTGRARFQDGPGNTMPMAATSTKAMVTVLPPGIYHLENGPDGQVIVFQTWPNTTADSPDWRSVEEAKLKAINAANGKYWRGGRK